MSETEIKVICPKTNEVVGTGIDLGGDAETIRSAQMTGNSFGCPACGATHTWDKLPGDTLAVVRGT